MKRIALIFLTLLCCFPLALNAVKKPNFAFPKDIITTAGAELEEALAQQNSPVAVRQLLNFAIATKEIDPMDTALINAKIALADSLGTPAVKALCSLLRAQINSDEAVVISNIEKALSYRAETAKIDLTEFKGVIDPASAKTINPCRNLTEYISFRAIDLLEWKVQSFYFPESYLCPAKEFESIKFATINPVANLMMSIYANLLKDSQQSNPQCYAAADIARLQYLFHHSYDSKAKIRNLLWDLYNETQQVQVLWTLDDFCDKFDSEYYSLLHDYLSSHPHDNAIQGILAKRSHESIEVAINNIAPINRPVEAVINVENCNKGEINIYELPMAWDVNSSRHKISSLTPVQRIPFELPSSPVPFHNTTRVNITFPRPGFYAIAPANEHGKVDEYTERCVTVTNLAILGQSMPQSQVYVTTLDNGSPVDRAKIITKDGSLGYTDKDGALSTNRFRGFVRATKDGDISTPIYNRNSTKEEYVWKEGATGVTDLALVHPGDTVNWMGVVYRFKGDKQESFPNKCVNAKLKDSQYQTIDSLALTSDDWGRISGSFAIPKDVMMGRFSIIVWLDEKPCQIASFMVSDYKMPSFKIDVKPAECHNGSVTLRGTVNTYSGFPMARDSVKIALSVQPRWRTWFNRDGHPFTFANLSCITGDKGEFEITVSKQQMELSPIPRGMYKALISSTSASGESQETTLWFSIYSQYFIESSIPRNIDASNLPFLSAKVIDFESKQVDKPINFALLNPDSTVVAQGSWPMQFGDVASGEYILQLSCEEAPLISHNIVVYRPSDTSSPYKSQLLWSPVSKLSIPHTTSKADWLYAVTHPCHLLVTMTSKGKVLKQQWVASEIGMHSLDIVLPQDVDEAKVNVTVVGNYKIEQADFTCLRDNSEPKTLDVTIASFRDKVSPLAVESWKFSVSSHQTSAMVLDVWNQALEPLRQHNPKLCFSKDYFPDFYLQQPQFFSISERLSEPYKKYETCDVYKIPGFETYGYDLSPHSRIYGLMNYSRSMNKLAAAPLMDNLIETESVDYAKVSDMDSSEQNAMEEAEYRPFETPLCAFLPNLLTNKDGTITVDVKMPNEITTWCLKALAYDKEMRTGSLMKTLIASRPVMVKANVPRFLRLGDEAVIQASIMNNTDSLLVVNASVELFNLANDSILFTVTQTFTVEAFKSHILPLNLSLSQNQGIPGLGYRVRCWLNDGNSDGEQGIIPVLPSVTPIIETQSFVLTPEDAQTTLAFSPRGQAVLQYNTDPAWEMVKALPGILDFNPTSATQAAASYFSASTAQSITRQHPEIREALKAWFANDGVDSLLLSKLLTNEQLKISVLSASPWVINAEAQNTQMAKLSLLLNGKEMEKAKKASLSALIKLQNADGGFRWMNGYDNSSPWVTENVLWMIASTDCNEDFVAKAVGYIDRYYASKSKKYNDYVQPAYAALRQHFSYPLPADCRPIMAATIQHTVKTWANHSPAMQAVDALILQRAGYHDTACEILKSLDQRSKTTHDLGTFWPTIHNSWFGSMGAMAQTSMILDAFNFIEPSNPLISTICQWIIMEKTATDWGASVNATRVIYSVLSAVPLSKTNGIPSITFRDKQLEINELVKATGCIEIPLTSQDNPVIIAHPQAPRISYGAIYNLFSQKANEVKAASCSDLKIKREYVNCHDVGDKCTIKLIIEASRDMDYVTLIDLRPACFAPIEQMPGWNRAQGVEFYRETRDSETKFYIDHLSRGRYELSYEVWVNNEGTFAAPPASIQSQYQPALTAHSAGQTVQITASPGH